MSNDKPVGIITEKDIFESILSWYDDPSRVSIHEIMSYPLVAIETDRSIKLAVIREGELVGVVTEKRLLAALIEL